MKNGDKAENATSKERRKAQLISTLERERKFEKRVREAAGAAWALTLLTLPTGAMMLYRAANGAPRPDGLRGSGMLLAVMGGLGLLAALLTTSAWLFRRRAPALSAIDARLANLEELLLAGRERARASEAAKEDP